MDTDQALQEGIAAVQAGRKKEAQALLAQVVKAKPDDPQGWLWLAAALDGPDQRRYCLQRVVTLDPTNPIARKGLAQLAGAAGAPPTTPPRPAIRPLPGSSPAPAPPSRPGITSPPGPPHSTGPVAGNGGAPSAPLPAGPASATAPASVPAAPRPGIPVLRLVLGCVGLLVVGLMLLIAVPVVTLTMQTRNKIEEQTQTVMFAEAAMMFSQPYPEARAAVPYINGKALVLDGANGMVHDLHFQLPDEIRAVDPGEVGTVIRLDCPLTRKGLAEEPFLSDLTNVCEAQVIDLAIPAVIAMNTFAGRGSTDLVEVDPEQPDSARQGGDSLLTWINQMPVIGGGVDRKSFCAAAALDRFRQVKFDPQRGLADLAAQHAVEQARRRGCPNLPEGTACEHELEVGQPQWVIQPSRLGCEVGLQMTVAGQAEKRTLFVIALPSQKVYIASKKMASYLDEQAQAGPRWNPFWRALEFPAALP